jgi:hypothetical protein
LRASQEEVFSDKIMKQQRQRLVTAFFIVTVVASLLYAFFLARPTIMPQYEIASITGLRSIWLLADVDLPIVRLNQLQQSEPFLAHDRECVIFLERVSSPWQHKIKCVHVTTGDIQWESSLEGLINAAVNNSSYIFVVFYQRPPPGCRPIPKCDSVRVTAYDITSGQMKWSEVFQGIGGVSQIDADESLVHVRGGGGHGAYVAAFSIEASTGQRVASQTRRPESQPLHQELSKLVGKDVVGNIVVNEGIIYFSTDDTTLWALSEETKEVLGKVSFAIDDPSFPARGDAFHIAAQGQTVLLYFKDSQQLFAFRWE